MVVRNELSEPDFELIGYKQIRLGDRTVDCRYRAQPIASDELRKQLLAEVNAVAATTPRETTKAKWVLRVLGLKPGLTSKLNSPKVLDGEWRIELGVLLEHLVTAGKTEHDLPIEPAAKQRIGEVLDALRYVPNPKNRARYDKHTASVGRVSPESLAAKQRLETTLASLLDWVRLTPKERKLYIDYAMSRNEDMRHAVRWRQLTEASVYHNEIHLYLTPEPWKELLRNPLRISIEAIEVDRYQGISESVAQREWKSHDTLIRKYASWTDPSCVAEAQEFLSARHLKRSDLIKQLSSQTIAAGTLDHGSSAC